MNYDFLCGMLSECREFAGLKEALGVPYGKDKWRPCLAGGLCDGAFQLFTIALAKEACSGIGDCSRLLVICSDDKEASRCAALLEEAEIPAVFYPARDFNFSNITASHDFEHERLSVLCRLSMTNAPIVVCTTAEAALQTTVPEDILESRTVKISADDSVNVGDLCERLGSAGYARVELVDGVGQFAVRGGIIDVFPPGELPLRLELFGDEIDRMGTFDIMTQRFGEFVNSALFPPVREVILSEEGRKAAAEEIRRCLKKAERSNNPLAAELLRREYGDMQNIAFPNFADKYIGTVYPEKATLLSYYDGVIEIHDTAVCLERARAGAVLLEQSMTEMLENGEITYAADDNPYTETWDCLMRCAEKMPSVFTDVFSRTYSDVTIGEIFDFSSQSRAPYGSNAVSLMEDLSPLAGNGYKICVLCGGEAEERNLYNVLFDEGFTPVIADSIKGNNEPAYKEIFGNRLPSKSPVALLCGEFPRGFEFARGKLAVFDYSSDGTGRRNKAEPKSKRKRKKNTKAILSSHDLEVGDLVVHEAYGIGMYEGIENLTIDGVSKDYINIRYAGKDKLFLPVEQLDLVSKYIGASDGGEGVKLSRMGGTEWSRSKAKAKKATKDMAKELIELYAKRRRTPGISFEKDDAFSRQFADAFEYEETDSQLAAVKDLTCDMERPYPMDRIICGDVGYGKTEVAMRAAFKAAASGYQTAVLVPTTILAFQHYQTFSARFRGFPVSIDMISRFRTPAQREASVRKLKRGETDIIIGTHRLISKDIEFKKLGLIIIDEEQRFGVAQKEKLKQLATSADVLTLTATPIPRTLNMAMGGILDMSVLDDVPGVRSPVQTYVMEHDEEVLVEAMRRELRRGGQVFYLHNRVESIYSTAERISKALPDARVAVGHGKLERTEIEEIWGALVRGDIDILVSTTIIETGIDVPNANTLIIDRADRYGLAQLHQIRGRVGRSARKAYAYFTYPTARVLSETAEKRLRAIKEYASFGAGFKIAMRDLEIRGAGNLLGAEQHGHMDSVGYDMYIKLLNEAVLEETGKTPTPPAECAVSLKADAFIPKKYISHSGQRMEMYKKVAGITDYKDFEDVIDEFCDRFGDLPSPTLSLCSISYIRALGILCRIKKIEQRGGEIILIPDSPDPFLISEIAAKYPKGALRLSLSDGCSMCFKLKGGTRPVDFTVKILETYLEEYKRQTNKAEEETGQS